MNLITGFLDSAFSVLFYFVPIAFLFVYFGLGECRDKFFWRGVLFFSGVFWLWRMVMEARAAMFAGRYYLTAAALTMVIAIVGVAGCAQIMKKYLLRSVKINSIIIVISLLLAGANLARTFTVSEKRFLHDFATILHPYNTQDTLLIDATADGNRIRAMNNTNITLAKITNEVESYYFYQKLFRRIESAPLEYNEVFLLVNDKLDQPPEFSLSEIIRKNLLIFPFENIAEAVYRNGKTTLYRYNGKIGDDIVKHDTAYTLNQGRFAVKMDGILTINPAEFTCNVITDGYTEPWGNGSIRRGKYSYTPADEFVNLTLEPSGSTEFTVHVDHRNSLLWPIAAQNFPVTVYDDDMPGKMEHEMWVEARNLSGIRPLAEYSAVVNLPEKIYGIQPDELKIENFLTLPATQYFNRNLEMEVVQGKVIIKNNNRIVASAILLNEPKLPQRRHRKVALIENNKPDLLPERFDILRNILLDNNIDAEIVPISAVDSRGDLAFGNAAGRWTQLNDIENVRNSDYILFNLGENDIEQLGRYYLIAPERQEIEANLKALVDEIAHELNFAHVALILPITPSLHEPYFDYGTSLRWNKKPLAHNELRILLEEMVANGKYHNIEVVALGGNLTGKDRAQYVDGSILEPMRLNNAGYRKAAATITNWILLKERE